MPKAQGGKGGGARKIGQNKRKPTHARYNRAVNKDRSKASRANRLKAAALRRQSKNFIVPMDAMIRVVDLPKTARKKYPHDLDEHGKHILVPHPKRGISTKTKLGDICAKREDQQRRIDAKREQRRKFSALGSALKRAHREAGREHKTPKDLLA